MNNGHAQGVNPEVHPQNDDQVLAVHNSTGPRGQLSGVPSFTLSHILRLLGGFLYLSPVFHPFGLPAYIFLL